MPPGTSVQKAYDHIRARIAAGAFPPGQVLSEAALAKELGVSRTPVGEALRELATAGLVEQVPRYGTIVRSLPREELVELYELREALEPYATALAAGRISGERLGQLRRLCDRIDSILQELRRSGTPRLEGQALRDFLAADMAFHTLLIAAAGNRRIARLVRDTHLLGDLFGTQRRFHDERVVAEAGDFHNRILAAVARGDADAARAAAAEHVRASLGYNLACFDDPPNVGGLALAELPADVVEELRRAEAAPKRPRRKPQP